MFKRFVEHWLLCAHLQPPVAWAAGPFGGSTSWWRQRWQPAGWQRWRCTAEWWKPWRCTRWRVKSAGWRRKIIKEQKMYCWCEAWTLVCGTLIRRFVVNFSSLQTTFWEVCHLLTPAFMLHWLSHKSQSSAFTSLCTMTEDNHLTCTYFENDQHTMWQKKWSYSPDDYWGKSSLTLLDTCMRSNSTSGSMSSMIVMSLVNLFMILPTKEQTHILVCIQLHQNQNEL